ncbi:hypothetical protein BMS3Bbin02_01927 [bacterium BMS3Bbin02]|nr:hypothetical protein BMS3Bbin02_01927 [bacterium BMS3Bbin02]
MSGADPGLAKGILDDAGPPFSRTIESLVVA